MHRFLQLVDWGMPNERTLYELPGDEGRLMMLLRTGGVRCYCTKTPCPGTSTCPGDGYAGGYMLSSTCVLPDSPPPTRAPSAPHAAPVTQELQQQHVCRPGTGLYNTGLPGDRMPPSSAATRVFPSSVHANARAGAGPWPGTRTLSLSLSLLSLSLSLLSLNLPNDMSGQTPDCGRKS